MKEELGKWFIDISKYITTAVFASTIFGIIENSTILAVVSIFCASTFLLVGLHILKDANKEKNKNNKRKDKQCKH